VGEQRLPDAAASTDDPGSGEALLLGAQPAESPDKAAAASPITYAGDHAPPFFLAHGKADRFVPPAQSATRAT
jgi:dipeptidyl aminopeptidase/acylaminoacyl peptidase